MRLEHIRIDNFRGLSHVDMSFSQFGCLIGENNAGKSSVFQALNMFLRSGSAVDTDFLNSARPIRIQLTFAGIGAADLQRLEESHRSRIEPVVAGGRLTLATDVQGGRQGHDVSGQEGAERPTVPQKDLGGGTQAQDLHRGA